jgi:hypothetical protein
MQFRHIGRWGISRRSTIVDRPFSHRPMKRPSLTRPNDAGDQRRIALRLCGLPSLRSKKESVMKLATILLASAFALSGTFAFAQAGSPNGTAGGPTSLSGTGPSTSGGDSPGAVGRNGPAAGGSMSGGTTGSAASNQPCDNPNGCPSGPTSLSGTGSSQFGGSTSGGPGKN